MVNWIENKYVTLLSNRLPMFTKKGNSLWNFRCPICGDSKKDRFKARGFIYEKTGSLFYRCHNCQASTTFSNFLRSQDSELHKQYEEERFKEKYTPKHVPEPEPDIGKFITPKFIKYSELSRLKKVSQLDPEHPAKKYVSRRLIPNYFHSRLFYAPKFKRFVNTLVPDKFANVEVDEPRLIIPLVDTNKNLFGFQGRNFTKTGIRYITIILDESQPKVFGLDTVDPKKDVYVFEGPIDSMFISNSLAMVGSSLDLSTLPIPKDKFVVVFDNEPRNKEIVRSVEKYIEMGYRVCIWPNHIEQKDINDMVIAGIQPANLKLIIDNNTFQGLSALVKFNMWKKI